MIAISHQARILVCVLEIDFRCVINTLGRICRETLKEVPMSGAFFVFRNRRRFCVRETPVDRKWPKVLPENIGIMNLTFIPLEQKNMV